MMLSSCPGAYHPDMLKSFINEYQSGHIDILDLMQKQTDLQKEAWLQLKGFGIDLIALNDVFLCDPVYSTLKLLGLSNTKEEEYITSCTDMKSWFNSDIQCHVPHIDFTKNFSADYTSLLDLAKAAAKQEIKVKFNIIGPITLMGWCLDKKTGKPCIDQWQIVLARYKELLKAVSDTGVEWIEFDEPMLTYDLPADVVEIGHIFYQQFKEMFSFKSILAVYGGPMGRHLKKTMLYPVDFVLIDLINAPDQYTSVLDNDNSKSLALGVVDINGQKETNLTGQLRYVERAVNQIGLRRTMVSLNCPLYFSKYSIDAVESFADKAVYTALMAKAMNQGKSAISKEIEENTKKQMTKI